MYQRPRRPFYRYHHENEPQNSVTTDAIIDPKRFWKLLNRLTRRKEAAQDAVQKKEKATTGS